MGHVLNISSIPAGIPRTKGRGAIGVVGGAAGQSGAGGGGFGSVDGGDNGGGAVTSDISSADSQQLTINSGTLKHFPSVNRRARQMYTICFILNKTRQNSRPHSVGEKV